MTNHFDNLPERLANRIEIGPNGCWNWTGALSHGYGHVWFRDLGQYAHRVVWTLLRGPIPDGLHIDHLCENRACVNPEHLEPVQPWVNLYRGNAPAALNLRKTHCLRGHPLAGDNLRIDYRGNRRCRICQNAHQRASYHKHKAAGR